MPAPRKHGVRRLMDAANRGVELGDAEETVQALVAHYAEDAGGLAMQTNRELSVLRDVAIADVIIDKALAYAAEKGVMRDDGSLLPVLGKSLLAYINSKRLALVALGLRPDRTDKAGTACATCGGSFTDLTAYLAHRATCTPLSASPAYPTGESAQAPAVSTAAGADTTDNPPTLSAEPTE